MNIQGLDYNTQREPLLMPEYGREIQKMVDHAISLPTRAQRLACAKTIIRMMSTKVVQQRDNAEYRQMLWDHLYLMSRKQLDIDWPYDVSQAEKFHNRPAPMPQPKTDDRMGMRHYGRLLEEMFERLKTMPAGKERDALVSITAHQMKRVLMTWGHGSSDNEKVADDMARYTDGKIQIDLHTFKFERISALPQNDNLRKRKKR